VPALARSPAAVRAAIERGVNRLTFMQTGEGGLAYWPGGREPDFWVSAYGGLALGFAQRQGVFLPAQRVESLFNYLRAGSLNATNANANGTVSGRCLALWALAVAGRPEPGSHEALYEYRERMSAETRALLALAILEAGGDAAMARELLNPRKVVSQAGEDFGCPARELAIRLLAWCRLQPDSPEVDRLVAELLQSQTNAHWTTTQGNVWAVLAMAEYARRVEGALQATPGALALAAEQRQFQLPASPATFETAFRLAPMAASTGLMLDNPQKQRLFTQTRLETRSKVVAPPAQNRGFAVEREYAIVADDGSTRELRGARVGDRVLVTLRIATSRTAHFVAVDDPLPALFEAVNPEFKTQQTRAGASLAEDWVSDYRELRADRALFFCDHLPPGTHTLRYLARVRAAGNAVAPGAKVEEMYHPERFGLTETVKLEAAASE
jgi:alpha-2-macroglobulin